MPRKKLKFYDLKKPRLRQSWHPINLYNLSRQEPQSTLQKTFFQQKWAAKSLTRAYHGEQIRERQWELQFSKRLPSVVPMDPQVLARSDGSDMAAGRGSGRDERSGSGPGGSRGGQKVTPYMNMVFYPQERRLDTCIFRALFASSARQARQMVTHGHVRVNGKKMIYPGYLLNPGDMFSVDPEMVLFCTGQRPRMGTLRHKLTEYGKEKEAIVEMYRAPIEALRRAVASLSRVYASHPQANSRLVEELQKLREDTAPYTFAANSAPGALYSSWRARFDAVRAREPLLDEEYIRAAFVLDSLLLRLTKELEPRENKAASPPPTEKATEDGEAASEPTESDSVETPYLSAETLEQLAQLRTSITAALRERITVPLALSFRDTYRKLLTPSTASADASNDNVTTTTTSILTETSPTLLDALFTPQTSVSASPSPSPTKPLTAHLNILNSIDFAWQPKDYMSPFAFIPRYLEVNQNVCSAVYLRHPVARPGLAEVPSPFGGESLGLAFQWYLRRR